MACSLRSRSPQITTQERQVEEVRVGQPHMQTVTRCALSVLDRQNCAHSISQICYGRSFITSALQHCFSVGSGRWQDLGIRVVGSHERAIEVDDGQRARRQRVVWDPPFRPDGLSIGGRDQERLAQVTPWS
ncbi:hypothetical protein CALCODRAFT_90228 [Calocera cornea HHB12733]|uniref:Uncharacterized protein n=1 Tax=Calocera cornea HHB12733 TaxID=1353952 RepID=A0A165DBE8_9BASI|nr:hypothetical protein CALCODRAFT_90228 [Calocera cornea HHB12733]